MILQVDHIQGHAIEEADGLNELRTLRQLRMGLATLSQTVAALEAPFQNGPNRTCWIDLSPNGVDQKTADLLPCLFHWYGTSIYNYARLVGFLSGISGGLYTRAVNEKKENYKIVDDHCTAYVKSIPELESIVIWRHKVFAHFALTAPRKSKKDTDNAALLDLSTMSPILFSERRFRVGGVGISVRGAESTLPSWSLTESYEAISKRYWPTTT